MADDDGGAVGSEEVVGKVDDVGEADGRLSSHIGTSQYSHLTSGFVV